MTQQRLGDADDGSDQPCDPFATHKVIRVDEIGQLQDENDYSAQEKREQQRFDELVGDGEVIHLNIGRNVLMCSARRTCPMTLNGALDR